MKILITGGAGYIGTRLCYELNKLDKVEEIIVLDNLSTKKYNLFFGSNKIQNPGKLRFIHGEILDSRLIKKLATDVDTIIHLAAKVTSPLSDKVSHEFEQVNNWGSAELSYIIESSSNIKQAIYFSSGSVYGATTDEVDENSPLKPVTPYGISKMRGERHFNRLEKKLKTYILRCGNVYGYSKCMRFDSVVNKFIFQANFLKKLNINGDGNQRRAFVQINSIVQVVMAILNEEIEPNTYNVVEENLSINQLVDTLKEIFPKIETIHLNQHLSMNDILIKPNPFINEIIKPNSLIDNLKEFKSHFAF